MNFIGNSQRGKLHITGHRGCGDNTYLQHIPGSYYTPENSLASFENAIMAGADAIECDIHTSNDHIPMVIHNNSITSTAYFLGACEKEHARDRTKYCSSYSAYQLQTEFILKSPLCIPFAPLNGETVEQQRALLEQCPASFRVPTLRELLILVNKHNSHRSTEGRQLVSLNIELKGLNSAIAVLLELSSFFASCAEAEEVCFVSPELVVLLGKLSVAEIAIANDLICCSREMRDVLVTQPSAPLPLLRYGAIAVAEHYCMERLSLYLVETVDGGGIDKTRTEPRDENTAAVVDKLFAAKAFVPYSVVLCDNNECFLIDKKGSPVRSRSGFKSFFLPDSLRGDIPLCSSNERWMKADSTVHGSSRCVLLAVVTALLPHMMNDLIPQKHQPGQIRTQLVKALTRRAEEVQFEYPGREMGSLDNPTLLATAYYHFCAGVADIRCTVMIGQSQLYGSAAGTDADADAELERDRQEDKLEIAEESQNLCSPVALTVTAAGRSLVLDCFARGFAGIDFNLHCCSPSILSILHQAIYGSEPTSSEAGYCLQRSGIYYPTIGVNACRAAAFPCEVLEALQDYAMLGLEVLVKVNKLNEFLQCSE